jgi:rhodanese-related sulfurtransferase
VAALRNGTMGWTLAGFALEHGAKRRAPAEVPPAQRAEAARAARAVADRAGVRRARLDDLARWQRETDRTTYLFDVRTPEEFAAGHLPGFRSTPGGQLVQETDVSAPVRGARLALVDDDGVRANMTASWLAQMNWEVWVLDDVPASAFTERGTAPLPLPAPSRPVTWIAPRTLAEQLSTEPEGATAIINLTSSANHLRRHIAGAWFALRSDIERALAQIPRARRYVLTCGTSLLAQYAVDEVARATGGAQVLVLDGGNQAWFDAGLPTDCGDKRLASPRIDRYRRPYEGTDNPREAMQAYLDWELGLLAQLARDGTHGFRVV